MPYWVHATTADHDLVEISGQTPAVCDICAKYVGRVYSLSGKSRMFARLPRLFRTAGYEKQHQYCNVVITPYFGGSMLVSHCGEVATVIPPEKVAAYSSRPYADERTEKDIAQFEYAKEKLRKRQVKAGR